MCHFSQEVKDGEGAAAVDCEEDFGINRQGGKDVTQSLTSRKYTSSFSRIHLSGVSRSL